MLRFLKRIRQKLLEEGNLQKYLLYAVGEIALVVVGILLALQINNWNNERKDRQLEKQYIVRLKNEMADNLVILKDRQEFESFGIENVDRVLKVLNNDAVDLTAASLAVGIEQTGWSVPIHYNSDVWNELISNGNIGLLQNDELRDRLTAFHSQMKQDLGLQGAFDQFNYDYRRLAGDILDPELRVQIASKYGPGVSEGKLSGIPKKDYLVQELKKLQGLRGFLADIKMARGANVHLLGAAIARIEEIIQVCESQLE